MDKFYNSTKFRIILRVKEAVHPVYFIGNMDNFAAVQITGRLEKNLALLVLFTFLLFWCL